jgi:hypothetical protein
MRVYLALSTHLKKLKILKRRAGQDYITKELRECMTETYRDRLIA